ncbi:protein NIM1-INTERACTING 1-like [Salvia divinorum]|uniref:Protein NIM1-INTERACTING 1-like n=1 Tax=Salvia divinorum TaxID=28513 RepID=A0ABD1FT39_SALDI
MNGEKKKRKMEENEDEDEEVKMEKFFALIKSSREVREQLAGASVKKERATADNPQSTPWNPTFVLEDFVEVEKESTSKEGEKRESGEKKGLELDLNLSL